MTSLRIDKLLWYLRFARSRTIAQKMISQGLIRIDRQRATSASVGVRPGQTLTISAKERFRVVRIDVLPTRRGPAPEAQAHYTELLASQPIDAPGASA